MNAFYTENITLANALKNSKYKIFIASTGGGHSLGYNLVSTPGASSYFVGMIVPYAKESLIKFIKSTPDKFCSSETTLAMATASYNEAKLSCQNDDVAVGVAINCSLATLNEREGRKHRAYIAIHCISFTALVEMEFKTSDKNRYEEDEIIHGEAIEFLLYCLFSDKKSVTDFLSIKNHDSISCIYHYVKNEHEQLFTDNASFKIL